MANKLKELYESFGSDKRIKILAILGAVAILMLVLSDTVPAEKSNRKEKDTYDYFEYSKSLEEQTESLMSSIDGVGRCQVMITLKNTSEAVYAKNTDENTNDGSNSIKYEYVLYDGQSGEQPMLIKEYYPDVQGVAVVCDGADNTIVRESIINSIASLFDIPVTKISVSKYKG